MRHIADRFTVILDANVLYPFLVRDVLLSFAQAGLFRARWSRAIMDEWARNLMANKPEKERQIHRTVSLMNEHFPEAVVEDYEALVPSLSLPDETDRHVLAAAVRAGAHHIVTSNLRDFPETELSKYGIEAKTPDDFLHSTFELYSIDAIEVFREIRARYKNPPVSKTELILALIKSGLIKTAGALKPHIESL